MPLTALKLLELRDTMRGRILCSPAVPLVMNLKSRPGDENRSNMPYSADAVTSGTARMATMIGFSESAMTEMTSFQQF